MVLGDPHAVESEGVGELDFAKGVGIHGRFTATAGRGYGKLMEEIEYQDGSPMVFPPFTPVYCQ